MNNIFADRFFFCTGLVYVESLAEANNSKIGYQEMMRNLWPFRLHPRCSVGNPASCQPQKKKVAFLRPRRFRVQLFPSVWRNTLRKTRFQRLCHLFLWPCLSLHHSRCHPPAGPPPLSQGAIDRRIRRAMEPNAKGEFKVSSEVRKLWEEGSREKVFRLFADCGNDTDTFVKRHSVKKEHEKETELGVYFTFLTESQFGDRSEKLRWISCWIFPAMLQTFQMNIAYCSKQTICVFLRCYTREDQPETYVTPASWGSNNAPKHTPLHWTACPWHRRHYVSGARQLCFDPASARKVSKFSCQTWRPAL